MTAVTAVTGYGKLFVAPDPGSCHPDLIGGPMTCALGAPLKKTHRVATVGFLSFNSQLACASGELEGVQQANACACAVKWLCTIA